MRIGIVDDERPARSELRYLLESAWPEVELMEADCAEDMLELVKEKQPDVCFVDINLNGMNGTTLASMLKRSDPGLKLVFATAYPDYAVKAFELGAVDYLLKPFDLDRVQETVKRLKSLLGADHPQESPANDPADEHAAEGERLHKIMVQGKDSFRIIDVKDIVYIEIVNRACKVYTAKEVFTENQTLNYYENRLAGDSFFRIHKSYLVNLDYMKELIPLYNNGYGLKLRYYEKEVLPVGRTQIRQLRQRLE